MSFESSYFDLYPALAINSLAAGKFAWNFTQVIFRQILVIDGWGISCEIALIWMSLDFTNDQSNIQVMVWCLQATSHYLSQCWPRSMPTYGITRPQWVNSLRLSDIYMRQMHICISNLIIIGSDNGLLPFSAKPLSEPMLKYCLLDP